MDASQPREPTDGDLIEQIAGNWPMELEVQGLEPPSGGGGLYQLWLTKGRKACRALRQLPRRARRYAVVPMNAPCRFDEFDGWVVVEEGLKTPVLTT